MIYGGNHYEYPTEYTEGEIGENMKEYEEWMWDLVLEDGPPQDDDITWIKDHVAYLAACATVAVKDAGTEAQTMEEAKGIGSAGARELQKRIANL